MKYLTICVAAALVLNGCGSSAPKTLGVFVETASGFQEIPYYVSQSHSFSGWETLNPNSMPKVKGFRGFYVNLPESGVANCKLMAVSEFEGRFTPDTYPSVQHLLEDAGRPNAYRIRPAKADDVRPGTVLLLRLPMALGVAGRIYPIDVE